ncbi:MAG: Smr/MutS family protein [Oligoflexus sp.]
MKKRKHKKPKADKKYSALHFEIEDDADELIRSHLEEHLPPNKDHDLSLDPEASVKKTSSRKRFTVRKLDLHGMTVSQAQNKVESVFMDLILDGSNDKVQVQVITGKGLHSGPGGGVLAGHIHSFICRRFASWIVSIDESPDDLRLNGIPIRGHFNVILKP